MSSQNGWYFIEWLTADPCSAVVLRCACQTCMATSLRQQDHRKLQQIHCVFCCSPRNVSSKYLPGYNILTPASHHYYCMGNERKNAEHPLNLFFLFFFYVFIWVITRWMCNCAQHILAFLKSPLLCAIMTTTQFWAPTHETHLHCS